MKVILLLLLLLIFFLLGNSNNSNNELWVIRNALPPSQLDALRARLPRDRLYLTKTDAHIGQCGRKSVTIDIDSISTIIRGHTVYPGIRPEYRVYYTGSRGMDWHRDQRVLSLDYYECVLTLFNDSDSVFEYKDRLGVTRTIRPTVNTLIMLKPEGVKHRVTPVTRGNREILKFVVVPTPMVTGVHNDTLRRRTLSGGLE